MSLSICSLNSGSNGNCYYIGNAREAVLVDVGISCREVETRAKRLGLSLEKVKAIFISHEHTDHIRGLPIISKKYNIPVYITTRTLRFGRLKLDKTLIKGFQPHESVSVGELTITPFPKFHDAADPYSFSVRCKDVTVGVFTDIGKPCENLVTHFRQCHAAFLESNYDDQMLQNGSYPYVLKKRITSDHGHLSNTQALELFKTHRPAHMSHLILSHLSKNNNCPKLVEELFNTHANGVQMVIASRYNETPVFNIENTSGTKGNIVTRIFSAKQLQLRF